MGFNIKHLNKYMRWIKKNRAEYKDNCKISKEYAKLCSDLDFALLLNKPAASCLEFISAANRNSECRHYAIADESDNYLGTISLKDVDTEKKTAEYAISTRSCAHGTGAAMQATEEVLKIAFEQLNLERVYLNVLVDNARANAFYKKAGFRFERCEEHAVKIRGEWKDLNWYAINREEFLRVY